MVTRLCTLLGWLALLCITPGLAQAAPTEVATISVPAPAADSVAGEARFAFDEGLRLLRAEQWRDAEASFRRSLALVPRPSAKYNLAFVLYKQDKLQQSSELLQQMLSSDDAALDARYRDYAKVLLANVLAAVSVLHLAIEPEAAEVRVDGELVAIGGKERSVPVDPGAHEVQVSAHGFASQAIKVVATAHSEARREIALRPLPASATAEMTAQNPEPTSAPSGPRAPTRSPWVSAAPWITIGVGGALLVAAVVTGVLATHADDDFTQHCPTLEHCSPELRSQGQKVERLATATNILAASGAALVVGGITWRLLLRPLPAGDAQRSALVEARVRF